MIEAIPYLEAMGMRGVGMLCAWFGFVALFSMLDDALIWGPSTGSVTVWEIFELKVSC